jgi:bacterioferritin
VQYVEGKNLIDMIKENLVAERVAIETYREMVRYFGEKDPTTRTMLERILSQRKSTRTTCTICSSSTKVGRF